MIIGYEEPFTVRAPNRYTREPTATSPLTTSLSPLAAWSWSSPCGSPQEPGSVPDVAVEVEELGHGYPWLEDPACVGRRERDRGRLDCRSTEQLPELLVVVQRPAAV